MRSMILGAKLPKNLWAYAIKAKCYTLNRTGTTSNTNFATPYEQFWKKKPKIGHLRIFGSLGYATSPRKKKKLDPRSQRVRMLGYDDEHAAYVVEFLDTGNIGISRSVDFDENQIMNISHWGKDGIKSKSKMPIKYQQYEDTDVSDIWDILQSDDNVNTEVGDTSDEIEYTEEKELDQRPIRNRRTPVQFQDYILAKLAHPPTL
jgi:hypothetical protein